MPDSTLWSSLARLDTLGVLLTSGAIGAFGGLARSFVAPTSTESSETARRLRESVVGAVAAIGALFLFRPSDGIALAAMSVLAGYAGRPLLDSLAARLQLATARQQLTESEADADEAVRLTREALALTATAPQAPAEPTIAASTRGTKPESLATRLNELEARMKRRRGP